MKKAAYIILVLAILVAISYFVKQNNETLSPEPAIVEEEIVVTDENNVEETQDIIIDDDNQEEIEAVEVEETNPDETSDEDETIVSE